MDRMASTPTAGGVSVCDLTEEVAGLQGVLVDLDPDGVALSDAPRVWGLFEQVERAGAAGMVLLARRVDESKVAEHEGMRSTAEYLASRSGSSIQAAANALQTSKRLPSCPQVAAALRQGELSAAQAHPVADAAEHDPESEPRLVDAAASMSLNELRHECLRTKAAADPDPEATRRRIRDRRYFRQGTDGEGGWTFSGRGSPECAGAFNAALNPIIDEVFRTAWSEGHRAKREQYAFDALLEMARRAANSGSDSDGDASDRPKAKGLRNRRRQPTVNQMAILRLDLEALRRGDVEDDERCEITGVGPISIAAARELLGESILKLVLTRGTEVAHVTHLGRGPNAAQKVALLWSQPTCSVKGCSHTFTQVDHRVEWRKTHHTRLDELDRLCPYHHRLKTHKGWALVTGTGKRDFVPPDDARHPSYDHRPSRAPPRGAAA